MKDPEIASKLRFVGAVEFGSRALGVNTNRSDYDFAMTAKAFEEFFGNSSYQLRYNDTLEKYFKVTPPDGFNQIFKYYLEGTSFNSHYLDVIVVEFEEDLEVIRKAVKETAIHPTFKLRNKAFRIKAYETALFNNGWIHTRKSLGTRLSNKVTKTLNGVAKWILRNEHKTWSTPF